MESGIPTETLSLSILPRAHPHVCLEVAHRDGPIPRMSRADEQGWVLEDTALSGGTQGAQSSQEDRPVLAETYPKGGRGV